jgi:hypothetical protein
LQNQTPYLASGQAAYIYVCDDPTLLYAIQEDSVGGSMVSGASGRNANLIAGSGSTVTSQSGWLLDSSTLATTAAEQLRIVQALQETDNTVATAYCKWLVRLNFGIHPWNVALGT